MRRESPSGGGFPRTSLRRDAVRAIIAIPSNRNSIRHSNRNMGQRVKGESAPQGGSNDGFAAKEAKLVGDFARLSDWETRYQYIMKIGERRGGLSEDDKTEENLVRGCQSQVWLTARLEEGFVTYSSDSDSAITKGLAALLAGYFSGETPEAVLRREPGFLKEIGLDRHLSPTRANGLLAMVRQIKVHALGFLQASGAEDGDEGN